MIEKHFAAPSLARDAVDAAPVRAQEPLGLSQVPYVVVPESKKPHQTLATAQNLPDLSYFGIVGSMGAGDPIDLYRLTLNEGVGRLSFSLTSNDGGLAAPMQFEVFDGSGRMLGVWTSSGKGDSPLGTELSDLLPGTTLYLGVSVSAQSSGALAGPSGAFEYQLWIDRQSAPETSTPDTSTATTVTFLAMTPVIGATSSILAAFASVPASVFVQGAPGSPESQTVSAAMALGSPAVRFAKPSAGLLADGDPAPPAAQNFQCGGQQESGTSHRRADPRRWARIMQSRLPCRASKTNRTGWLWSAGRAGFRLMGAVAIGHRYRNTAINVGDFETPAPALDLDVELASGLRARPHSRERRHAGT